MYFVEILQTKNIAIGVPQDSHQHHVHELSSGVTIYSRDSGLNFVRIIIIVRNIFPGCKPWNLYTKHEILKTNNRTIEQYDRYDRY